MTARIAGPATVLAAAIGAAICVWVGWSGPVRATLGVLLVVWLPGTALLMLLDLRLRSTDAIFASIAASIAIAVVAGVGLGGAHAGFGSHTWATCLCVVAAGLSAGALAGRLRAADPPDRHAWTDQLRAIGGPADAVLYTVALGAVGLAVVLAHQSAVDHNRAAAVAEMWVVPAAHPVGTEFDVVVKSLAGGQQSYAVALLDAHGVVVQRIGFALEAGRSPILVAPLPVGGRAKLYREQDATVVYREVGAPPVAAPRQLRALPRQPARTRRRPKHAGVERRPTSTDPGARGKVRLKASSRDRASPRHKAPPA